MLVIIGWVGSLLYLLAQMLLAIWHLPKRQYILINAVAALLVSWYSLSIGSLQPIVINLSWIILSIVALLLFQQNKPTCIRMNHKTTVLLFIGVLVALGWWLSSQQTLWHALSWLSVWLYLASYLAFILNRANRQQFLIAGIFASGVLIPQLTLDANYPVLAIQVMWVITSSIGLFRTPQLPPSVIFDAED